MGTNLMAALLVGIVTAQGPVDKKKLVRSEGVGLEKVEVRNGRLWCGEEESYWHFRKTPRGTLIYVPDGGFEGWYLSYDHKGKDRRVSLVPEIGPGCYWQWTEGPWVDTGIPQGPAGPGGPAYTISCRARPINGPLKGMSLTLERADLVLVKSAKQECCFVADINGPDGSK